MSIEFNDETQEQRVHDTIRYTGIQTNGQLPGMVRWLMKRGVKTESAANGILVGVIIVVVALSLVIYYFFVAPPTTKTPHLSPQQQSHLNLLKHLPQNNN